MLLAVCQEFGLEPGNEAIPRIAFGFAGGIGNTGSVCGAVAGGTMAISLKLGSGSGLEDKLRNLRVAGEFRRRFEAEKGTISCRELTGLDLSVQENMVELMSSDVPQKVCFPAVATAYRLVLEVLREAE